MDAILSGHAGVALLFEGDELSSIHFEGSDEVLPRSAGEVHLLFAGAQDLQFLKNVDLEEVRSQLDLAGNRVDALHLALNLLDAELSEGTRRSTAEDLDELLENERIARWVESVLFAHPLPRSADPVGARSACIGPTERTRELLRKLESLQPVIVEVQRAWEAIPSRFFATEEDRKHTLSVAVKEGLFRDLVAKRAAGESVDHFLVNASNSALQDVCDARQVLTEWVADFSEPRAARDGRAKALRAQSSPSRSWAAYDPVVADRGRVMHRSGRWAGAASLAPFPVEAGREKVFPFPEGVDGETGHPVPSPGMDEVARLLAERPLRRRRGATRAVIDGVSPEDLAEAGWGVLFPKSAREAEDLRRALKPLLDHRKDQAGSRYREYLGDEGYFAGERTLDFLHRHRSGPGRVDPKLVPYYLLIVGSPEQVPYEFQYGLDLHHAVGRIHFDTVKEYESYAEAVVSAETAEVPSSRTVALFGPRQDEETRLSADALLSPIADHLRGKCQLSEFMGVSATKTNLARLLGGDATPDLLFTAGHGLVFRAQSPRQRPRQGALVCQEWPGWDYGPPAPEQVFAADDVKDARLQGLIALLFASHSAGTPSLYNFAHEHAPGTASYQPFVSSLAQRLLASGALAVVGHVERDWRGSFLWWDTISQSQPFAESLRRLVEGGPLGWALEPINQRHADLAASLGALLEEDYFGLSENGTVRAELWTASRDVRSYLIVGDPAVRLPVKPKPERKRVLRSG